MRKPPRRSVPKISAAYVRLVDGHRVKARQVEEGGLYAPPPPRAAKKSDIGDPGTIRLPRGGWLVDDGYQVYGVDAATFEADYQAGTRVSKAAKAKAVAGDEAASRAKLDPQKAADAASTAAMPLETLAKTLRPAP